MRLRLLQAFPFHLFYRRFFFPIRIPTYQYRSQSECLCDSFKQEGVGYLPHSLFKRWPLLRLTPSHPFFKCGTHLFFLNQSVSIAKVPKYETI